MRKISVSIFIYLISLISFAQDKIEVSKLSIDYTNSFGSSGNFLINLNEKKIEFTKSPVFLDSLGNEIVNSKQINNRIFYKIKNQIDAINFNSLDTITGSGIDGLWFFVTVNFSNGNIKKYKIWDRYASEPLLRLFSILSKKYK